MGYWYDLMVEEERRRHEMVQADAWRRHRPMDGARTGAWAHQRFLSLAGRWLESVGRQLRRRYEPGPASKVISQPPVTPPCG